MKNYPYIWLKNIIRMQEKREYDVLVILLFAGFVGSMRLLLEWMFMSATSFQLLPDFLITITFYWHAFFVYTLVVRVGGGVPWRQGINVILIGVFLGIFPPVIDLAVSGLGSVGYRYMIDFPRLWNFYFYNPAEHFPIGEALVLWSTILLSATYVFVKTRNIKRVLLTSALAYLAVLYLGGLLPSAVFALGNHLNLDLQGISFLLVISQILSPMVLYFVLQPQLVRGLLPRFAHAAPFLAICFAGAAYAGTAGLPLYAYMVILAVILLTAIAQNDLYDRTEDALQARKVYLDRNDVVFLNITSVFLLAVLMMASAWAVLPLLLFLSTTFLYNYPFYRGKRYFPANLKIEGVWGGSAFLVGMIAGMESIAMPGLAWALSVSPQPVQGLVPFTPQDILALFLVFGGWSLVASLKDYKDWEADLHAGNQTLYTLAHRRGWHVPFLHMVLIAVSAAALLAPVVLLFAVGRLGVTSLPLALAAVGLWVWLLRGEPSNLHFRLALYCLAGYFLGVGLLLQ